MSEPKPLTDDALAEYKKLATYDHQLWQNHHILPLLATIAALQARIADTHSLYEGMYRAKEALKAENARLLEELEGIIDTCESHRGTCEEWLVNEMDGWGAALRDADAKPAEPVEQISAGELIERSGRTNMLKGRTMNIKLAGMKDAKPDGEGGGACTQ